MKQIVFGVSAGLLLLGIGVVFLQQLAPPAPSPVSAQVAAIASTLQPSMPVAPNAAGANLQPAAGAASHALTPPKSVVVNPYAASLQELGKSKRFWNTNFMSEHQVAGAGDPIQFELTEGTMATGVVQITQYRNGELAYISGELTAPESGKFFFLTPPAAGLAGSAVGVVEFPASQTAYRIEPTGPSGAPELWARRLDEVICVGMPKPVAAAVNTNLALEMPPLRPDNGPDYVPSYNSNVVSLQSYPGSKAVLLLDFFGGYTPTWGGVYYSKPANIDNSTIRDVWKRVAEDFMPFNINVTTDIQVYQAAAETSRQRCAFTDTPVTAAGVAYYGSWNWGGDTPCWSVYSTGKSAAEVGAHEPGHTLGLSHQGQWNGVTTTNEYYGGQGSGETGWAPIMGVGYYQPVATWAKGEYNAANQPEDELTRITTLNNNVAYRVDDTGATLANSRYLEIHPDFSVSAEGVIERTSDTDAFQFTTTGGTVALTARPVGDWANLAVAVSLADSANNLILSNNPQATVSAGLTTNLPAGTYTFRVTGVGKNNPLTTGFSAYASLGYYSIMGSVAGGRLPTRLSVFERVGAGAAVGTVPAVTNDAVAYAIVSGNTGNTFAIDNNGLLTVANGSLLNYAQLATNSMLTVGFELFVNITNLNDAGLTELNRRVVVSVLSTNANYPLVATGFNAGIIVPYNATPAVPKSTGFDVPNNYAFYQAGLSGNAQVSGSGGLQGFPANRLVVSQVDNSTFQLGPYGGTNALMMGGSYPAFGTLVLATPQPLKKLAILASSANGGGNGTFVLNYTNGTKSAVFSFNAQDWYGTTTNIGIQGVGRVKLGQATFNTENAGWNNPNVYQTTLDLAVLGLNQTIASITFTNPAVAGSRTTAILALSGQGMSPAVSITRQPVATTNSLPAQAASFSVAAMGTPPLFYQWYKGNPGSATLVAGQTTSNLLISAVQPSNAGNYFAVVTNSSSAATSSVAALTVFRSPQIVQQPAPSNLILHTGESLSLAVVANAATPVNYYWRTNGVTLPGATSATLNFANLQLANSASYSVIVSNAFGSVTSSVVSLSVVAPAYPYAQLVVADNPISYWRLDELSGPIAYDYVGGKNGTYSNVQFGQPGYNLLDAHKAARFGVLASVNSYVGGIPIDFGAGPNQSLTVETWVNGATPSTDAGLITKGTGAGGEQVNLDCGGPGHAFRFFVRADDGNAILANSSITPNGQWHHVVGVVNRPAGYIALYVDGVSNASATIATENFHGLLKSTNALTIGSRQSGTTSYDNQFIGTMEDVAIYNYALTPARILAHYGAATNRPPVFVSNPFSRPTANAGQFYSANIATSATEPNTDVITYAKVSGPAWLAIGASGVLSGVPANANANTNSFVVSARDGAGLSNVATMTIYVNATPTFTADPFSLPDLAAGQSLAATVATNVSDLNTVETFTFAKLSGPAWLNVASDGSVSGTPVSADVGTNSVLVSVTDSGNLTDSATLLINVLPVQTPLIASISPQGADLLLSWSGGLAPYQILMNTNLAEANWTAVGPATTNITLLITPSNAATFYRIMGN